MTKNIHDPEAPETTTRESSQAERGGLGLAALLWLLGVPGLIVLLFLLF